jgi:hypothetical protein
MPNPKPPKPRSNRVSSAAWPLLRGDFIHQHTKVTRPNAGPRFAIGTFSNVRILENPDDSFEDAHLFPRCAPAHARIPYNPRRPCRALRLVNRSLQYSIAKRAVFFNEIERSHVEDAAKTQEGQSRQTPRQLQGPPAEAAEIPHLRIAVRRVGRHALVPARNSSVVPREHVLSSNCPFRVQSSLCNLGLRRAPRWSFLHNGLLA